MPIRPDAAALAASLLLAGCGSGGEADEEGGEARPATRAQSTAASATPATPAPPQTPGWELVASGEGTGLRFPVSGAHAMLLFCPAGGERLLVNVRTFRPIGSEERLSFGSGAEAHALVADTRGDSQSGGVTGEGAVPANLAALIAGPVAASYGAQQSGPHPAPPAELARGFVEDCLEGTDRGDP